MSSKSAAVSPLLESEHDPSSVNRDQQGTRKSATHGRFESHHLLLCTGGVASKLPASKGSSFHLESRGLEPALQRLSALLNTHRDVKGQRHPWLVLQRNQCDRRVQAQCASTTITQMIRFMDVLPNPPCFGFPTRSSRYTPARNDGISTRKRIRRALTGSVGSRGPTLRLAVYRVNKTTEPRHACDSLGQNPRLG